MRLVKMLKRYRVHAHVGQSNYHLKHQIRTMARTAKQTTKRVKCEYFCWILNKRSSIFQADGRNNHPAAGRHSSETRSEAEALDNLKKLDQVQAVRLGLADKSILADVEPGVLLLEDGEQR